MTRIKQMSADMRPAGNGPARESVRLSEADERTWEFVIGKLMAGEQSGFVVDFDRNSFMKDLHGKWTAWILKQS